MPGCEAAPKVAEVKSGEEVVEASCSAAYTKAGTFTNVAAVEGNHKQKESNKVEAGTDARALKWSRSSGLWGSFVCDEGRQVRCRRWWNMHWGNGGEA